MDRTAKPSMKDPADTDIHSASGKPPYPQPGKTTNVGQAARDTEDPGDANAKSPHDRGSADDGEYDDANTDMLKKVKDDKRAWEKGKTQNR